MLFRVWILICNKKVLNFVSVYHLNFLFVLIFLSNLNVSETKLHSAKNKQHISCLCVKKYACSHLFPWNEVPNRHACTDTVRVRELQMHTCIHLLFWKSIWHFISKSKCMSVKRCFERFIIIKAFDVTSLMDVILL